jgi:hypothetical protein
MSGFVCVELVRQRRQVRRGAAEFFGRTVMRAGVWLYVLID